MLRHLRWRSAGLLRLVFVSPTRIDPGPEASTLSTSHVQGITCPIPGNGCTRLMTLALNYLDRGYKGLVSYVESNNFDSLKSVSRMGYEKFGSIYLMRAFGRYLIHVSPGCERFGFAIEEREGELAEL